MSGDIEIREAQRADYEKVAEMHYPVWLESYTGITVPHLLDIFVKHWADNVYPQRVSEGWTIMLAESDGEAVGVTIFGPQPGNPDHLEIDALYIRQEDQRRGIGGVLLDMALASQPSADVVLWCAEKNCKARCFYEKKGFQLDGRTFPWEPIPGVKAVELGYTLHRSVSQG